METPLPFLLLCHLNVANRQIKKSLQPTPPLCLLGQCKQHCAMRPDAHFILHAVSYVWLELPGWRQCLPSFLYIWITWEIFEKYSWADPFNQNFRRWDPVKGLMKSLSNDANIWLGLRIICQRNSVRKFYQGPYVANSQVSKLSPREVSLPWATGKWQDRNSKFLGLKSHASCNPRFIN